MMQNWLLIGMKNMADRILIDTNVLLDYLLTRDIEDYKMSEVRAILSKDYRRVMIG